ncbi:DNA-directed RNA polymerase subunit beta [Nocardia sp. CA-128927]|uniref:DNA-directed RNA polymerase subunit beta n=1 Tax=Nocardia sp. CA-128927 TaxID=3239975 RepID=UPI003D96ED5C
MLESACRFYVVTCGLPAVVRPDLGRIVFRAGTVGAITMPAHIGARVRVCIEERPGWAWPIVSHPRSKRWTFLVGPNLPSDDVALFAEMFRHNVSIAPMGAEVALPSPLRSDELSCREWVCQPRDGFRPPGTAVVEAIRCCLSPHWPVAG